MLAAPRPASLLVLALSSLTVAAQDPCDWAPRGSGPAARTDHAMAYRAGGVVLFGGEHDGQPRGETWVWDGQQWSPRSSGPARWHHAMAPDSRGRLIVFGGKTRAASYLDDTWAFNGTAWQRERWTRRPAARIDHAMAFGGLETFLFGGSTASGPQQDTWVYYPGTGWNLQTRGGSRPSPRTSTAVAYDSRRKCFVLFGGVDPNGNRLGDTWEWRPGSWSRRSTSGPAPRGGHTMAYEAASGEVVLYGGRDRNGDLADTWQWNGSRWARKNPACFAPARTNHAMAYDSSRRRVVMHGGITGSAQREDAWELGVYTPGWRTYGSGCPCNGRTPAISAASGPRLGRRFALRLAGAPAGLNVVALGGSDEWWLGVRLPVDLTPFGMPGCNVLASPDVPLPFPFSPGNPTWTVAIPRLCALLGQTFFVQLAVRCPGVNPLGLVVSNAGAARVGR